MTLNYKHIRIQCARFNIRICHFTASLSIFHIFKASVTESNSEEIFSAFAIIIKSSCRGKMNNVTHLALKNSNRRANLKKKKKSKCTLKGILFKVNLVIFQKRLLVFKCLRSQSRYRCKDTPVYQHFFKMSLSVSRMTAYTQPDLGRNSHEKTKNGKTHHLWYKIAQASTRIRYYPTMEETDGRKKL